MSEKTKIKRRQIAVAVVYRTPANDGMSLTHKNSSPAELDTLNLKVGVSLTREPRLSSIQRSILSTTSRYAHREFSECHKMDLEWWKALD